MKKLMIAMLAMSMLSMTGCSNSNDAKKALSNAGMTDVTITGYKPFTCSKDDFYSTGFEATNPQGKRVSGTVCSGMIFKSSTIRW